MTGSFSIEFDPLSSRNGWMDCWLVVDGRRHGLDATSVFPPFGDVLAFARALAENRLPHEFLWDEEGHGAKFQALPVAGQSQRFKLCIDHDGKIIVDAEFDRMQIAGGLLESLRRVALDCPGAESEWDLPYFLIEDFERGLARGFVPPFRTKRAGIAHFVFNHYHDDGVTPAFNIWVGDDLVLFMALDDSAHHWHTWFELLASIGRGELPAEVTFKREAGKALNLFLLMGVDVTFRFQAEPVVEPGHFRLKVILYPHLKPRIDRLIVETVLDRRQFVHAFARAFKQFLETDYLAFLESGTNEFDLRSLPLDRLTS
jgi:hypothetical protein